jgi:molecular chaperone DnaK
VLADVKWEALQPVSSAAVKAEPLAFRIITSQASGSYSSLDKWVFQGEREIAAHNKLLGQFNLEGIPPSQRGLPQIEVTFDINANGILSVTAKDKGSGKEQSITITGASTLPNDEVERLVRESEQSASVDKEKREKIDLKNQADSLCYQSEKQVEELKEKITSTDKENILALITKLKSAIKNDGYDEIKSLSKDLQNALMEVGKKVYSSGTETSKDAKPPTDSVIDADFSETK